MLLSSKVNLSIFESIFNKDLEEMYNFHSEINQETKYEIKKFALSFVDYFVTNIIMFNLENGVGFMTDENNEILFNNFISFVDSFSKKLEKHKENVLFCSSVHLMWTGILTQLEKECKSQNNYDLLIVTQSGLLKYFEYQKSFYKHIVRQKK